MLTLATIGNSVHQEVGVVVGSSLRSESRSGVVAIATEKAVSIAETAVKHCTQQEADYACAKSAVAKETTIVVTHCEVAQQTIPSVVVVHIGNHYCLTHCRKIVLGYTFFAHEIDFVSKGITEPLRFPNDENRFMLSCYYIKC
ncbi:MAG: hypothetical protein IJR13_06095 [Bacteroidales bacterium]|nr:hypothetical protein [Bacteroidales bacterium]